jgi:membrane glycosyltransferase
MAPPAMTRAASRRRPARQWGFAALVLVTTAALVALSWTLLRANGMEPFEYPILALSTVLAVPIVASFWLAVTGFLAEWLREVPTLAGPPADTPLTMRTAIVMPIHNEDAGRSIAALRATYESLAATGQLAAFRCFVLSDSTDPQRWLDEEIAVAGLRAALGDAAGIVYRHRATNTDRKVGNLVDFCRRWGAEFECMVVLDADSVMSGDTLVHLARCMQAHPGVGILQVPPVPVNGATLFSRVQQFAANAYGRTFATGLAWLQGGDGNYYGHNAIVRIRPYVVHCALPPLPGREPLGGAILSHDFVEAAMMCRAGYTTHLLPAVAGSFEESPPTLLDHANRDRRWCQGNIQHSRLLHLPGLRAMSRTHLAMGIMSYVAAPLWLALLMSWTAHALWRHFVPHDYFTTTALFPTFEVSIRAQSVQVFLFVLALLFVPRVLAVGARLMDARERAAFGGARALLLGFATECVLSLLLAPALMIEHTRAIVAILRGRSSGWSAQRRGDDGVAWRVVVRRFGGVTIVGAVWATVLALTSPATFWWMAPVLAGMVFAVPLAIGTSSVRAGGWTRRHRLLLTPAELVPEPVLVRFRELVRTPRADGVAPANTALERVLQDAELRRLHATFADEIDPDDAMASHATAGLVLKYQLQGPAALTIEEQRNLLRSPDAIATLALALRAGGTC